jgi:RNA polymerase sigma-70 factor, ECF subfamily
MSLAPGERPADSAFARAAAPLRRELLAHCYRMLGSWDEAEDVVQDTYLRGWRAYEQLEDKDLLRAWLYRIATNACFTAIQRRRTRPIPAGIGASEPDRGVSDADLARRWLEPMADAAVTGETHDPAVITAAREGIRLALIATLQHLPPRQRAVLLMRDVLAFPAAEVADMLGTSPVAVKSALQRARERLHALAPDADRLLEPDDPLARRLLDQYVAGFEHADIGALEAALRADAEIELVAEGRWFRGKITCMRILSRVIGEIPGQWRMRRTVANGQPTAVSYLLGPDGRHVARGISVLTVTPGGISTITVFHAPGLVARFGLPAAL